nr:hypothetical protein [Bacteroides intestinalis]
MLRLASASLFKNFPGEGSEVDSFKWFRLAEVVNVVLAYLNGRDRGKYLKCCGCIILKG